MTTEKLAKIWRLIESAMDVYVGEESVNWDECMAQVGEVWDELKTLHVQLAEAWWLIDRAATLLNRGGNAVEYHARKDAWVKTREAPE